jgi:hypothetical protein
MYTSLSTIQIWQPLLPFQHLVPLSHFFPLFSFFILPFLLSAHPMISTPFPEAGLNFPGINHLKWFIQQALRSLKQGLTAVVGGLEDKCAWTT